MKNFDSREFRTALSGFATGVTIMTSASADGEIVGMTASSFNSVSMEPPLILWCVTKTALSASVFKNASHFSAHVLAADQIELCNQFAKRGSDKFANVDYQLNEYGVPVLGDVVARFDCSTWAVQEGGDHWIIIGEVQHLQREIREGLVFSDGTFATANALRQVSSTSGENHSVESPIDGMLIYNLSRAYQQISKQFHNVVRDSGLTIPAWRILASLYGKVTRDFQDLEARTFLDSEALTDALTTLQMDGLCNIDNEGTAMQVTGTDAGHVRVQHLFELGERQQRAALGIDQHADDKKLTLLVEQLAEVVRNTNDR